MSSTWYSLVVDIKCVVYYWLNKGVRYFSLSVLLVLESIKNSWKIERNEYTIYFKKKYNLSFPITAYYEKRDDVTPNLVIVLFNSSVMRS